MNRRSVLAAGTVALTGCTGAVDDALEAPDAEEVERLIREAINELRATASASGLDASTTLAEAATRHSRDMAERDFYGHENPDGEMPWHRVPCQAGEVIHRGDLGEMRNQGSDETWYTTDTEGMAGYVIEGWKESASHSQTLTDREWSRVGVGVYIDQDMGEFFATAMVC